MHNTVVWVKWDTGVVIRICGFSRFEYRRDTKAFVGIHNGEELCLLSRITDKEAERIISYIQDYIVGARYTDAIFDIYEILDQIR